MPKHQQQPGQGNVFQCFLPSFTLGTYRQVKLEEVLPKHYCASSSPALQRGTASELFTKVCAKHNTSAITKFDAKKVQRVDRCRAGLLDIITSAPVRRTQRCHLVQGAVPGSATWQPTSYLAIGWLERFAKHSAVRCVAPTKEHLPSTQPRFSSQTPGWTHTGDFLLPNLFAAQHTRIHFLSGRESQRIFEWKKESSNFLSGRSIQGIF